MYPYLNEIFFKQDQILLKRHLDRLGMDDSCLSFQSSGGKGRDREADIFSLRPRWSTKGVTEQSGIHLVRFCPSTSCFKRKRSKEEHTEENYPVCCLLEACSLFCRREEKCIWVRWVRAGRNGGRGNWSKQFVYFV